jgi:single-strand DNA-binding protein
MVVAFLARAGEAIAMSVLSRFPAGTNPLSTGDPLSTDLSSWVDRPPRLGDLGSRATTPVAPQTEEPEMNETTVTVVGNVVDTPQRRKTEAGHSVASFRIASTNRRYDRGESRWTDGDSLYLRVTCWRALADNVDRSVVKGDPVVVTGRLFTRTYEVEGQRRSSYELEAYAIGLDLSRGTATISRTKSAIGPTYEVEGEASSDSVVRELSDGDEEETGVVITDADAPVEVAVG